MSVDLRPQVHARSPILHRNPEAPKQTAHKKTPTAGVGVENWRKRCRLECNRQMIATSNDSAHRIIELIMPNAIGNQAMGVAT